MRASLITIAAMLAAPAIAQPARLAAEAALAPAPLSELVKRVDIPYEQFRLNNGLRVVVHTDRKAPLVSVGVWYHVGSKDEPLGRGGFAHLFEHLMFGGTQNYPQDPFQALQPAGATDFNGTTWFDRTNYFQTVPTPALERTLWLESDRMGHFLPAVTQAKLDRQREVVKNEKRQGDNDPYGQVDYALYGALFPADHPYSVTSIGTPADLDAATLTTVREWFHDNYGPNNAVLVLAGDVDVATARRLAERYFGDIPPGPTPARFAAPVPDRRVTTRVTLRDRIATPRLIRAWALPGRSDPAVAQADVALSVLASGATSRLYEALVRRERLAVAVSGGVQAFEQASVAQISVDAAPGVDPAKLEARIDALLAAFQADGPTADEVSRVATRYVAGTIRELERVGGFGGKGVALAEGTLYAGDPGFYRTELKRYAEATPASVLAAARRWTSRGDLRLTVTPGEREAAEIAVPQKPRVVARAEKPAAKVALAPGVDRSTGLPSAGPAPALRVPAIERAQLANGMAVMLARVSAVPVVRVSLSLPGGMGADRPDRPGTQGLLLALLDEGTNGRLGPLDGPTIARRFEALGGGVGADASLDRTRVTLNALTPNLRQSVALMADIVRAPTLPADQLERLRGQTLTAIAQRAVDPNALAADAFFPRLYGPNHPYGRDPSGLGTVKSVRAVTRADLLAQLPRSLRPDGATLIVVGDTDMATVKPILEAAFGDWRAAAPPEMRLTVEPRAVSAAPGIYLIDRPGSPQSVILGGAVLPVTGRDDRLDLVAANDILGGSFLSRLNLDLREAKGWAYGASSAAPPTRLDMALQISAPVQTDKTGPSVAAIREQLGAFQTTRPPTPKELDDARDYAVRRLPGNLETGGALLAQLERAVNLGRPDDWLQRLPARWAALTPAQLSAAKLPAPDELRFVVVGDRRLVEPQLRLLNLPLVIAPTGDGSRPESGAPRPTPSGR